MDDRAFDRLTRVLGAATGRRAALAAAAGMAAAAAGLALPGGLGAQTVPTTCINSGSRCRRSAQCCSLDCRGGRCIASDVGDSCLADAGCAIGFCHIASRPPGFCRCTLRNRACTAFRQCCSGRCNNNGRCSCSKIGQVCEMSMHCCGTNICVDGICVRA